MNAYYKGMVADLVTMRLVADRLSDQVKGIPARPDLADQVEAVERAILRIELQVRNEAVRASVLEGIERANGANIPGRGWRPTRPSVG